MACDFAKIFNCSAYLSDEVLLGTVVQTVVSQTTFRLLIAMCILISLSSVTSNLVLIVGLCHSGSIQTKVKLLLVNVSSSAVVMCISEIVHKSLMISRTLIGTPKMVSGHQCLFESLPKSISIYSLAFSMIFVAWERAVATKNFRSYESEPKFLAWACVIFSWLCPTVWAVLAAFRQPETVELPFCFTGFMYSTTMTIVVTGLDLTFGLLSLSTYAAIIYINRRKLTFYMYNQAQLSLSGRYQLRNNIEMTNILIPSIALRVVAYAVSDIIFINLSIKGTNQIDNITAVLLSCLLTIIHSQIHPISMLIRSRKLRSSAKVAICRGRPTDNLVTPQFQPTTSSHPNNNERNNKADAYLFERKSVGLFPHFNHSAYDPLRHNSAISGNTVSSLVGSRNIRQESIELQVPTICNTPV